MIGLFLAGLITDTFEGINKIGATPTWCLWCAALACGLWILLYLLMDVAGWRAWSIVVRPAGANPLIAYFLHPIVIGLVSLTGAWSAVLGYKTSHDPSVVVGGSLAMAFFVCAATGLLAPGFAGAALARPALHQDCHPQPPLAGGDGIDDLPGGGVGGVSWHGLRWHRRRIQKERAAPSAWVIPIADG